MDHGGGMHDDMNMSSMGAPMYTHMTFFWGKNSEILFSGWPGTRGGMYALALILVFALAVLVEWLHYCRLTRPPQGGGGGEGAPASAVAAGLAQTALHAVRVGLAYLLMLAVMSFNGGVLVVAVFGHALGFLFFGSSVFRKASASCGGKGDLPPLAFC